MVSNSDDILLGIDIGNTKLAFGLCRGGKLISEIIRLPTESAHGSEQVVVKILESCRRLSQGVTLGGIGIAFGGIIDLGGTVAVYSPNFPSWHDVPLVSILSESFPGVPVALENDANAAAYGEMLYGQGKGHPDFVYMTISTGVGGAFFVDGSLVRGSNGVAGEFGHLVIEPDGPVCTCGSHGCLETLVSGTAIARQAREMVDTHPESLILRLAGGDRDKVDAHHVFEAARQGDSLAGGLVNRVGRALGFGLADVASAVDPDLIILGGGVMNSADLILPVAVSEMENHIRRRVVRMPQVVVSALKNDIALWGAFAIAQQRLEKSREKVK